MKPEVVIAREMEELRRQLHKGIGSRYDPECVQRLQSISTEFDRLALKLIRRSDLTEAAGTGGTA